MGQPTKRSYGHIMQRQKKLGLLMVNQERQSFFIYAEALLSLAQTEEELILIKHRDRNPESAIAYHGGSILATCKKIEPTSEKPERSEKMLVTLYFGEIEKKVEYVKATGELRNIIDTQKYWFPINEWETLVGGIEIMVKQKEVFDRLLLATETDPGTAIIEI